MAWIHCEQSTQACHQDNVEQEQPDVVRVDRSEAIEEASSRILDSSIDEALATAIRSNTEFVPSREWVQDVAGMQLYDPTDSDIDACITLFEQRLQRIRMMYECGPHGLPLIVDHSSYWDVQLAVYTASLWPSSQLISTPEGAFTEGAGPEDSIEPAPAAWPLALRFFGAFVGPEKAAEGESEKPFESGDRQKRREQWRTERAIVESRLRSALQPNHRAQDVQYMSLLPRNSTQLKSRDAHKIGLRVLKEVKQVTRFRTDTSASAHLTQAERLSIRHRAVPSSFKNDEELSVMKGIQKAGFESLEAYVRQKVTPRLTRDSKGRESTSKLTKTQRAALRLYKCKQHEAVVSRRNELKERTYNLLLGSAPPLTDAGRSLLSTVKWYFQHRRNCYHVNTDKSTAAHPWIRSLMRLVPEDSTRIQGFQDLLQSRELVETVAQAAAPQGDEGQLTTDDIQSVVEALHVGLADQLTEALIDAALGTAGDSLTQTAAHTVVKALLLNPSRENHQALAQIPTSVAIELFSRILRVSKHILHSSQWVDILKSLDELQLHSRRKVGPKRMHYKDGPGSAYYVLTHVSRVVTFFHAEELWRLYMTPRTPLAIDIYPAGPPVYVRSGVAVSGNLVLPPQQTWAEFAKSMVRISSNKRKLEAEVTKPRYTLTRVGVDVLTLLLHAPLIFSGGASDADILGLRHLPSCVRIAAAKSIIQTDSSMATQDAVEEFRVFLEDLESSSEFRALAIPAVRDDIENMVGTDNLRACVFSITNAQWKDGARPEEGQFDLVQRNLNLTTIVMLATELRGYPRSLALNPVALVRFNNARNALRDAVDKHQAESTEECNLSDIDLVALEKGFSA